MVDICFRKYSSSRSHNLKKIEVTQIASPDPFMSPLSYFFQHPVMIAAPSEVRSYITNRGSQAMGVSTSPPTRARAHRVLIFGRKFYLEDTVKVSEH